VISQNNSLKNYVISNKCDKLRRLKYRIEMFKSGEDYITRSFMICTPHQILQFGDFLLRGSEMINRPYTAPSITPRRNENLLLRKFLLSGIMK